MDEDTFSSLPYNHPVASLWSSIEQFGKMVSHLLDIVESPEVVHIPTFIKKLEKEMSNDSNRSAT